MQGNNNCKGPIQLQSHVQPVCKATRQSPAPAPLADRPALPPLRGRRPSLPRSQAPSWAHSLSPHTSQQRLISSRRLGFALSRQPRHLPALSQPQPRLQPAPAHCSGSQQRGQVRPRPRAVTSSGAATRRRRGGLTVRLPGRRAPCHTSSALQYEQPHRPHPWLHVHAQGAQLGPIAVGEARGARRRARR